MNQQNMERLDEHLKSLGVRAALLSSPWTITWLTGYAPPIQTGPSPFEGGPALAWWCEGELTLITSDAEAGAARASGAVVRDYVGYSIKEPPSAAVARQSVVLSDALATRPGRQEVVGVEMQFLPAALHGTVQIALAGTAQKPLDGAFDVLRAVKTPEEIRRLRRALALADLGQAAVREQLRAGLSEIELWALIEGQLEVEAGMRLPLLADLVGGVRTGDMGGLPGPYVLQPGDPVIADLMPRVDGYWGDNCGTHFVSEPSAEMRRMYAAVWYALRRGIEAVRPGLRARNLDTLLRKAVAAAGYKPHPHHSGHGLGASNHEEPRLVAYNNLALAPGMVVALEPGVYLPRTGGVRLEDVVLVTADGCEVLTRHLTP